MTAAGRAGCRDDRIGGREAGALRIGFDGRAFASPAGGVRRYVRELTQAIAEIAPETALVAIGLPSSAADSMIAEQTRPSGPAIDVVPARAWLPTNLGWSLTALPRGVRRAALDLFHAPAYTAPPWGVHPLVITIHDVSYERTPQWYPYRRDPLRRAFYRASARAADLILADSAFTRSEIAAAYGIADDRVRVVPLGVGRAFVPAGGAGAGGGAGDAVTPSPLSSFLTSHLPAPQPSRAATPPRALTPEQALPPTILHVGDLHPRRNLALLIDSVAWLRAHHPELGGVTLTLIGRDAGEGPALRAHAAACGVEASVQFVHGATDAELVSWYQRASVLAYPSLYEGFGLPVLEAMACGLPVIGSTAASVPEVIGDAGLLADPREPRAWIDALAAVLTSPARAAALREAGLRRAAGFSWQRTAALTLDVYREAIVRVRGDATA